MSVGDARELLAFHGKSGEPDSEKLCSKLAYTHHEWPVSILSPIQYGGRLIGDNTTDLEVLYFQDIIHRGDLVWTIINVYWTKYNSTEYPAEDEINNVVGRQPFFTEQGIG